MKGEIWEKEIIKGYINMRKGDHLIGSRFEKREIMGRLTCKSKGDNLRENWLEKGR